MVLLHHVLNEHVMDFLLMFLLPLQLGLYQLLAFSIHNVKLQVGPHFNQQLNVLGKFGWEVLRWKTCGVYLIVVEVALALGG